MAEGVQSVIPNIEEQKDFVATQLDKQLIKGEIWYMLDIKWYKQWKSYVGFDTWDHYYVGEDSANPGHIDNSPLFEDDANTKLKEHLIDTLDYILIPAEGWDRLLTWYSMAEGQEPLPRKVIEEGVYSKALKVEVYPWHLKVAENSTPDNHVVLQFSRVDTIEQLEVAMRREFNINEDKEVRLWNRYMTNMYEPLNKKENTLQDAGLYSGQIVVIEQKNDDGTWPRATPVPVNKNTFSSSSSNTASKPSSKGAYYNNKSSNKCCSWNSYDGYGSSQQEKSVTPGLCGLSNIGNTCFMNSALQCMSNVPHLTEYFRSGKWVDEVNKDNPLGMDGEIASSYAELIKIMWQGDYSYTVPRDFKYAVGRFAPQFSGYSQQDAQELMAFLLDGLHEDLNRIKKKPYIEQKDSDNRPDEVVAKEAWDNYLKRNNSIITDLFHGLLKSTVQCPECDKISVTFDPFCYLSLPMPVKKERQLEVFWVPQKPEKKPSQFKLTVPKMGCVQDICVALSPYVKVDKQFMLVTDVYNHRFHKIFAMNEPLSSIMDRDDIFVYEVPPSKDAMVIPIYMREERIKNQNSSYNNYQLFGQPLLLSVQRQNMTYEELYTKVCQRIKRFVQLPAADDKWWVKEGQAGAPSEIEVSGSDEVTEHSPDSMQPDTNMCNGALSSSEDSGMEVSNGDSCHSDGPPTTTTSSNTDSIDNNPTLPVNGHFEGNNMDSAPEKIPRLFKFSLLNSYGTSEMDTKFKDDGKPLKLNNRMYISLDWNTIAKEKFYDEGKAETFVVHETMNANPIKKQVIQLSDCIDLYTTTEKLGEQDPWYCPQCKKHQQATKKFDIWSLPDTLIIHLKRFSYNRYWRDKIDILVEFPTRDLNMNALLINPNHRGPYLYDLVGVVNHFGGLGGGHYTAYCRNETTRKWFYFDDSSVTEASEEACVSKAAYVLVYQKRGTLPECDPPLSNCKVETETLQEDSNKITDSLITEGVEMECN